MKKKTVKLLFVDIYNVNVEMLQSAIKNMSIFLIHQNGRTEPFLLDTGFEVEKHEKNTK